MEEMREVIWRRAGRCETGACVEVAHVGDDYVIRDSKNPQGPRLTFTMAEWAAFATGVRTGEFDFD
jgi:hypothetical protein